MPQTRNEKGNDTSDCELGLCEDLQNLVLARCENAGGNRPGLDAIHINGNWGSTANRTENDNDLFCRHRGSLAEQRSPEQTQRASNGRSCSVAIVLESIGQFMDMLKEGGFQKITPKAIFVLYLGYAHLPDGQKFVFAMVALLSKGNYDVIIPYPNREMEARYLRRPLQSEFSEVWSDVSNAMKRLEDHSLHMLVLDKVWRLELSIFSRQIKMKPKIDDHHQVIVEMSNDLWFKGMEVEGEEKPKRQRQRFESSL